MKSSVVFPVFFALRVLAASNSTSGTVSVTQLEDSGCDILTCIEAFAPTISACATAVEGMGADIESDLSCITDVINDTTNAACEACLSVITSLIPTNTTTTKRRL